jgi:putative intracellular protease/amidase
MRERFPTRERFSDVSDQAVQTYRTARNRFTEYPGTIAAIVIGVGVTAALIWAARRAGGWRNLQEQAMERARQGYDYAREGYDRAREAIRDRAQRVQSTKQELTQ